MTVPTDSANRLPGRGSPLPWYRDPALTVRDGEIVTMPRNADCMPLELVRLMAWTAEQVSGIHQFHDRDLEMLVDVGLLAEVDIVYEDDEYSRPIRTLNAVRHLTLTGTDDDVWVLLEKTDCDSNMLWQVPMDRVHSVSVRAERVPLDDWS